MATKLCAPIIGGLLSNLSSSVFVSNCLPGSTILVRSLTRPNDTLVKWQIGAPDGFLPLAPGAALLADDRLVAKQTDASGNESPETHPELAVHVGAAPSDAADIIPVDIAGRLWECGRYAYVGWAQPGTTVEVVENGVTIGSATADGGVARIALTQALSRGTPVQVRQRVGLLIGPATRRDVEDLPVDPNMPLPAPLFMEPLRACQTAIRLEGVFEGSGVTITRRSGEVETAAFDLSGLWFKLATPLDTSNGWVKAKQEMPACRRSGDEAVVEVGAAKKPEIPSVSRLCAGAASVYVDNLERGAELRITVGADVYYSTASGGGHNRFDVDPLPPGSITVQSFLCGIGSDPAIATVEEQPAEIDSPVVVPRLVRCQRSVTLDKLTPGATIQVWAKGQRMLARPISDHLVARGSRMDVEVTTLLEGEAVWAVQWACAMVRRESAPEDVWPAPPISDPTFEKPVTRIDKNVAVKGTVRDAEVEILREEAGGHWRLIGRKRAKGVETSVPVRALAVDQVLQVRQRYCTVQTPGRSTIKVLKPVPMKPIIQSPAAGKQVPVRSSVALSWRDPATGADADRAAESFDVTVIRSGETVLKTSTTSTAATLPEASTAVFAAQFTWSVLPRNSTGPGPKAESSFRTPAAPNPTIQAAQDKDKIKVTGKGFAMSHDILIDVAVDYSGLVGSPNGAVEVNDNRKTTLTVSSTSAGAIDHTFLPKDELPPREELTGTGQGMQTVKAAPYPGAMVMISARNKPPISSSQGSANASNTATLTWKSS